MMFSGKAHRSTMKKYGLTIVALWTLFVVGLLVWSIDAERKKILEQARIEARSIWTHNLSYRKWITAMGGVYVRADRMPPNPYLKIKERDKMTTDGIALTLANPAYVTSQVFSIIRKESDPPIINRIVSEKYLNPANKPDAWEEKGLQAFAAGSREVSELTELEGRTYLRLFRPMITTEGCLLCHGEQGYKIGDIRGGISVAVPMAPYEEIGAATRKKMTLVHLLLWGAGAGGIVIYHLRIDKKEQLLLGGEDRIRLFSSILETSADAIIVKDLDSVILSWNKGAEDLYGYTPEEAVGQSIEMLIPAGHLNELVEIWAKLQQGERVEHYLTERRRKDGQSIFVDLSLSPLRDQSGQLVGASSIGRDMTTYKKAEEEIRALNAGLEQRVAERTRELSESQTALMNIVDDLVEQHAALAKLNTRLQELDRLKSMFIASMSHELRTPLNSIIGFSSILHDEWIGPVNDEQKKDLAIILRCGKHLLNLINDVIDVSKIEAGRIDSAPEEFDLYDLIDEAISLIRKELEAKGLVLRVAAIRQPMATDRRRLLQCVLNLLSNAMKYTERGEVSVEARLVNDGDFIEISVADTGIGIKPQDLPRMCHPFIQLSSSLKSTVSGTGLGLYLTRKLVVEVLKGDINITSEYGKGSRFTLRVPVRIS